MIRILDRYNPIGLDIGRRFIKAAQMTGSRLTAAASIPRDSAGPVPTESELAAISKMVQTRPFRGRSVVLSVPPERLMASILDLPPRSSGAPIEHLARVELGRRHKVRPGDVEMACWDLPATERAASRTCTMAVACRQADADELIAAFESHRLTVKAIDVHALAISRACGGSLAAAGGTGAAILDVGWGSSRPALLYKSTLVYEGNLAKCGMEAVARTLQERAGLDAAATEKLLREDGAASGNPGANDAMLGDAIRAHAESLANEVRMPVSYLSSQYSDATIGQLLLVGGGAGVKGLKQRLAEKLGIEAHAPALREMCKLDHHAFEAEPSMALALGLAMHSEDYQ